MKNKLIREYLNAVKIIEYKDCENPMSLLETNLNQPAISTIVGCRVKKGGYVLLDFGKNFRVGLI